MWSFFLDVDNMSTHYWVQYQLLIPQVLLICKILVNAKTNNFKTKSFLLYRKNAAWKALKSNIKHSQPLASLALQFALRQSISKPPKFWSEELPCWRVHFWLNRKWRTWWLSVVSNRRGLAPPTGEGELVSFHCLGWNQHPSWLPDT